MAEMTDQELVEEFERQVNGHGLDQCMTTDAPLSADDIARIRRTYESGAYRADGRGTEQAIGNLLQTLTASEAKLREAIQMLREHHSIPEETSSYVVCAFCDAEWPDGHSELEHHDETCRYKALAQEGVE